MNKILIFILLCVAAIACTNNNVEPTTANFDTIEEVGKARAATTAQAYQVFRIASVFSSTGSAKNVQLAVLDVPFSDGGAVEGPQYVTTANGYTKFSISAGKIGVLLKRKVNVTTGQTYYMLDRNANLYRRCGGRGPSVQPFGFLPTYLNQGLEFGAAAYRLFALD